MTKYTVTGMTCAACSSHVEKAVRAVEGVQEVTVSLLTNSMQVEGTASEKDVCLAVAHAGYKAIPCGAKADTISAADTENTDDGLRDGLKDTETPRLCKRLIASLCVLLPLMYLSMGHMMWGFPLPPFLENHAAAGLAQLLLSGVLLLINQNFFRSGVMGLLHRAPNMDTLVSMGAAAAFGYSTAVLFRLLNDPHATADFYFESAGMIVTLITLGKLLEARSKGKTTDALKQLLRLSPETATLLDESGKERVVPASEIRTGDRFVLRSGERVPADGRVLEGSFSADESALTGESLPVDKEVGMTVSAATVCRSGYAVCEATRVGQDTTLSQIIRMVSDAAATKAPIAKLADRVSGIFVPTVLLIAAVTVGVWLAVGETVGFALARGISVLVISCPCALGLATPVAIMVGSGKGAKNGILFKTAASLETAGRTEIVALDKTGTLTNGTPNVTDLIPSAGHTGEELLSLACTLEQKSEHPLSRAIMEYADRQGVSAQQTEDFRVFPGNGISALCNGRQALAGNASFLSKQLSLPQALKDKADRLAGEGKTPLYFAHGGEVVGLIAVADVLKQGAAEAVSMLKGMGLRVVMLSGDNQKTADAIGRQAGVSEVIAELLPNGKEEKLRILATEGKVAMVGDGINDAPALTRADLGIAIGAGTDVAIDAADVVLMKSALRDLPAVFRLGRRVLRNIRQNLFWAFFYNAVGIPLAAGVWIPLTGWQLQPMFGAAAMSLSSFCVVTNALRLNLGSLYDARHDHKKASKHKSNTKQKGNKTMKTVTIHIEGMMCAHCEQHVRKALESIDGVSVQSVSHLQGTAVVSIPGSVSPDALRQAVTDAGYEVKEIA